MAFISREYFDQLEKNSLIEHGDWVKLHRMSVQAGMKEGTGYAPATFRNAVIKGFTTTDHVVELIKSFYEPKVESIRLQRVAVNDMRRKLSQ